MFNNVRRIFRPHIRFLSDEESARRTRVHEDANNWLIENSDGRCTKRSLRRQIVPRGKWIAGDLTTKYTFWCLTTWTGVQFTLKDGEFDPESAVLRM